MNMGKKEQMGIIHRSSHPPLEAANYWTCWGSEDPSIPSFNPSTEHNIPHALSALIDIRDPEQPHLGPSPTHPLPTGSGAPLKLRPEPLVPSGAVLDLSVCLSIPVSLAGPWTRIAGSLLLSSSPSASCCSLNSSLVSICSLLECLDGPCFQCPFLPVVLMCCGTVPGLCWDCPGLLDRPPCRAALPVLLPGSTKHWRAGVLRQKAWGVSIWNLFLCSFETKCLPDLEFQGRGMFFQNNLLLWLSGLAKDPALRNGQRIMNAWVSGFQLQNELYMYQRLVLEEARMTSILGEIQKLNAFKLESL